MRVPTMPASSTITTEPAGRPPWLGLSRSARRLAIVWAGSPPTPRARPRPGRERGPDDAVAGVLPASRAPSSANVFPVPAAATTTSTASVRRQASTSAVCSLGELGRPQRACTDGPHPRRRRPPIGDGAVDKPARAPTDPRSSSWSSGAWIRRPLQRRCRRAGCPRRERHDLGAAIVRSGELLDPRYRRAAAKCFAPGAQHVASIERTRMGASARPDRRGVSIVVDLAPNHQPGVVRPTTASIGPRRHRARRLGCATVRSRPRRSPVVLRFAGIQRGDLRRPADVPAFGERASISTPPRRKARNTAVGIPSRSAMPLTTGPHATPSRRVSSSREVRLIEVAGGLGVQVEVAAVERRPPAIRPTGHVRHQNMGVEVWVAGPARPVPERRPNEPRHPRPGGRRRCHAATNTPTVPNIRAPRRPRRRALADLRGDLDRRGEQDGHRLRCPERQIEPRDGDRPGPAQPDTGLRVPALEHRPQPGAIDSPSRPDSSRGAHPPPWCFSDRCSSLLAAGDGAQVVVGIVTVVSRCSTRAVATGRDRFGSAMQACAGSSREVRRARSGSA